MKVKKFFESEFMKRITIPIIILLLLNIIFFSSMIFKGKYFYQYQTLTHDPLFHLTLKGEKTNFEMGDIPALIYPSYETYNKMIHRGRLFYWDPSMLGGYPYMASCAIPYFFYPPAIILNRLFNTFNAVSLFIFFHMLIGGTGMYFLARNYKLPLASSLFSAIAWMFCGQAVTWLAYGHLAGVYAYMPLVMLSYRKSLDKFHLGWSISGGVFLGLSLLSGHQQLNYYLVLFLTAYFLFRLSLNPLKWRTSTVSIAIIFITGFLLAAPQLLSTAELSVNSHRRSFSFDEIMNDYSAPLYSYILRMFAPDLLGNPALGIHFHPRGTTFYHEICIYAGILPIAFALSGITKGKKEGYFLACLAIFILLFASCTIAYYPFFKLVPGFNRVLPGRAVIIFFFCISILSGLGFSRIEKGENPGKPICILLGSIVTLSIALLILCIAFQGNPERFLPLMKTLIPMARFPYMESKEHSYAMEFAERMFAYYRPSNLWLFIQGIFALISLLAIMLDCRKNINRSFLIVSLLLLSSIDLVIFGLKFLPTSKPMIIPEHPVVQSLSMMIKSDMFRILRLEKNRLTNVLSTSGIEQIEGSRNMYPRNFAEIMGELESRFNKKNKIIFGNTVILSSYKSAVLDMFNVRYILSYPDPLIPDKDISLLSEEEGHYFYEKKEACPRIYFTPKFSVLERDKILPALFSPEFSPLDQSFLEKYPHFCGTKSKCSEYKIKVLQRDPDRLLLDVETPDDGILVFSDVYFPGWHAEVSGKKAELLCVNFILKGIPLFSGKHRVLFHYVPSYLYLGFIMQVITIFSLIAFFIRMKKRRPHGISSR